MREADRLGLGRDLAELDAIAEKAARRRGRGRLAARLPRAAGQRPGAGGAVPAARDRRGARGARGGGGAGGAGHRVGPHGLWAVRGHRRRRPGRRRRCRRAMRTRSWRRPRRADERERRRAEALAPSAADRRRGGDRRVRGPQPGAPEHRPSAGARGHLLGAGRLDLRPGRPGGLPGDRRLRRAGAPRRDGGDPRRRGRRTGRDLDRADDRGRVGVPPWRATR